MTQKKVHISTEASADNFVYFPSLTNLVRLILYKVIGYACYREYTFFLNTVVTRSDQCLSPSVSFAYIIRQAVY